MTDPLSSLFELFEKRERYTKGLLDSIAIETDWRQSFSGGVDAALSSVMADRLLTEWPQLNPHTTIRKTEHLIHYLPGPGPIWEGPPQFVEVKGVTAMFRRVIDVIRGVPVHKSKGWRPVPPMTDYRERTIQLKQFVAGLGENLFSIYAGYDAETDTLFVRE